MKGRVAVLRAYGGEFELREYPVPEVEPGAMLVRLTRAGVCGSDLHIWRGEMKEIYGALPQDLDNLLLVRYFLAQTRRRKPKVAFIGPAHGEPSPFHGARRRGAASRSASDAAPSGWPPAPCRCSAPSSRSSGA
jgi:hypothetical protein